MTYVRILVETGYSPEILDKMDIETIMNIILYKQIKDIAIYGGEWHG